MDGDAGAGADGDGDEEDVSPSKGSEVVVRADEKEIDEQVQVKVQKKKRKKKKKGKRKNQNVHNRNPTRSSYYPPASRRAQGHIRIPHELTTHVAPETIKESINSIYRYIDILTGFHMDFDTKSRDNYYGAPMVINYGFHDMKGKQLWCILDRCSKRGYKWKMRNKLFYEQDLMALDLPIPKPIDLKELFSSELETQINIDKVLNNIESFTKLLNTTNWNNIDIFTKKIDNKKVVLTMEKNKFIAKCIHQVHKNMEINADQKSIPILMFNPQKEPSIEFIKILEIAEYVNIGMSFKYDTHKSSVFVTGIHLDKYKFK